MIEWKSQAGTLIRIGGRYGIYRARSVSVPGYYNAGATEADVEASFKLLAETDDREEAVSLLVQATHNTPNLCLLFLREGSIWPLLEIM